MSSSPGRRRSLPWRVIGSWALGLAALAACLLLGELLVAVTGLRLPGTVLGLVLAVAGLALAHRRRHPAVRVLRESALTVARPANRHLQLFFLPAAVGITSSVARVAEQLVPLMLALVATFLLVLVVIGHLAQRLLRRPGQGAR
ncbi:CidA/LrgA family protein [Ruania suaedae]|uniref:CidA/LrgA family protein n=1 Tax=Ruania suaedae TaxID=2897774 RepID=UPI001E2CEB81|nr:CidA/LrgA family protein [Ruania suaedae]UFU01812.1 CidA/LrgA family protein [Ruania suaedae]